MHDARQNLIQLKNDLHISSRIKTFQVNYAHQKNHEIHEEVKAILFGMSGACLYCSIAGQKEPYLTRATLASMAILFFIMMIQQHVTKPPVKLFS